MNKKGFLLVEVLVSISFIMILSILLLNVSIHINSVTNEKIKLKKLNEEKAIIYREIGTLFSTKNIESIEYDGNNNKYKIDYYKNTVDQSSPTEIITGTSNISLKNDTIYIDSQKFESTDYLKYNNLKIERLVSNTNNNDYYIKLTIDYTFLDQDKQMEIFYVNNPINTLTNIDEVTYE